MSQVESYPCPACLGTGRRKNPGIVFQNQSATCYGCGGKGYIRTGPAVYSAK